MGGILRDIFTMGARPLAVMDSLRFGPIEPDSAERELVHRNHSIVEGIVSGIAGYGNCFGVPNLGGETKFEPCYSGNPLVNAFALGLVRKDEIFYAKASGTGNPVIYVGAKTGRDGIHGATMASEEFKEGSEQKRPNVQVGDPFMEKLLLEACLEAMQTGAIVGIQDMGAAGLTCSTCEMGARGGVGLDVELDLVPQRETGMSAYEIMLSESQERMLLVAEKGREAEVLCVFAKWASTRRDREYAKDLGVAHLYGEKGFTTLERLWSRPTLECNGIWGGYTEEGAKTVLPAKAFAKISMRLVPDQTSAKAAKLFEKHFKKIAPKTITVKVRTLHGGEAAITPIDSPGVKAAVVALEKAFGKKVLYQGEGGSIPIVAQFKKVLGIDTVLLGFGLPDENAHSPDEFINLNNFFGGIRTSAYFYDGLPGFWKNRQKKK